MKSRTHLRRVDRARIIRDAVLEAGRSNGRWRAVELPGGSISLVWEVDGDGWTAMVSTRFSGLPREVEPKSYEEAVLLQQAPPRSDDVEVDVYHPQAGKVLSIGNTGDVDTLIGMQPGPWEAKFGLPAREWTPAVQRRLERSRSGVAARGAL